MGISHKIFFFLLVILSFTAILVPIMAAETLIIKDLRCEYLENPLGIDVLNPRLSWILESTKRGQRQRAYQVLVASTPENLTNEIGDLWNSGKIDSDQSVHVVYKGKKLTSQIYCFWKVRIWDKDGKASLWSNPAIWSMGLLKSSDWTGQWIGLDTPGVIDRNDFQFSKWIWYPGGDPAKRTSPGTRYFRRTVDFPQDRKIINARYLITADNRFILYVNGEMVAKGDNASKGHNLNMAGYLNAGKNIIAVAATNRGPEDNSAGLIGVLCIAFQQGDSLLVPMDKNWRTSDKEIPGWKDSGFDDSDWIAAQELGECGIRPWGDISITDLRTRLPARLLRRELSIVKKVKRAIIYTCGLGFFELYLNGKKVGDHVMDPGLTEYNQRVLYVTFDITDRLNQGDHTIGVILGNGRFFAPRTSVHVGTRMYGFPKLLLQMHIEYEDGTVTKIVSDENWKLTTDGPIRANNEYDGEEYDARMERDGWDRSGFDASGWPNAVLVEPPKGILQAQKIEPMRVTQTKRPVSVSNPKPGMCLVDMGQVFYGSVRLTVSGPVGTKVQMRSAYSLKPDGTLKTEDNRSAKCTDIYILNGKGVETWQPMFKGQGYRYVEVTGFPGEPTVDNFEGLVFHTDMDSVGSFICSNPLLNKLYSNVRWGQRMYRRSVPLDPDRDERQGWLGDPAKDAESDAYNFNVASFYTKWLQDIHLAQHANGELPDIAPPFYPFYSESVVWPSVITIIPDWFYNFYGDRRILNDNYESMKKFVLFIVARHQRPDFTVDKNNHGDWCDASTMDQGTQDPTGSTSRPLISTAYFYNNVKILAKTAGILERTKDNVYFTDLAEKIRAGFTKRFFDPQTNTYESVTQCSFVLPLAFGLVPPENRDLVIENLVHDIMVKQNGHLSVGLIGMQWLMQTLSDIGHPEVAYIIAAQTTRPSWGYMISKGATSIWERWDTDTRDPGMNSEALLMLAGNLEAWFYQTLAGINYDPKQPGFKHIILRPQPVGDLTSVKSSFESLYGTIVSNWKIEEGVFIWNFTVPANTTATICIPAENIKSVRESGQALADSEGVEFLRLEDGAAVYKVDSGEYAISSVIKSIK
jgi:alpha-L-rhamnosidase